MSRVLPFWAAALLGFLIVARATRFLNSDYLAAGLRNRVLERFGEGKLYYLVTCPWCASIWIAAPVATTVAVTAPLTTWWTVFSAVALWLGYSQVYGLVASNLDADE